MKVFRVKIDFIIKIIVLTALLICIYFRFYKLNSIPPDVEGDAAVHGMHALHICEGINFDKILSIHYVYSYFYYVCGMWNLILALTFKLLGASRITLFIPTTLMSLITIIGVYYVSLKLFKNTLNALLSSFFTAGSLWYLPISRYGIGFYPLIPFLTLLTVYFTYQFEETRNKYYLFCLSMTISVGFINGHINYLMVLPVIFIYKSLIKKQFLKIFLDWDYWLIVLLSLFIYLVLIILMSHLLKIDHFWRIPYMWYKFWFKVSIHRVQGMFTISVFYKKIIWFIKEFFFHAQFTSFACFVVIGYALISPLESILLLGGIVRLFAKRTLINNLFLVWIFLPIIIYPLLLKNNEIHNRYFFCILPAICIIVGNETGLLLNWVYKKGFKVIALFLTVTCCSYIIIRTYNGYFHSYKKESGNLTYQYGFAKVCDYINNIKNDNIVIVLGDEVLVPYLQIHFYTKGIYEDRLFYLDKFLEIYDKNPELFGNKLGIFVFTINNEKVSFAGRSDNLGLFKQRFPGAELSIQIKYKDGEIAKEIYNIIL